MTDKNQLQKDIQVALSWKAYLPYEKTYTEDNQAFERLNQYRQIDSETCPKLQSLAVKYNFDINDTADILEEYILTDNEVLDLHKENERLNQLKEAYGDEIVNIKHTIKTMLENERTETGKNTLKQLWEAIQ